MELKRLVSALVFFSLAAGNAHARLERFQHCNEGAEIPRLQILDQALKNDVDRGRAINDKLNTMQDWCNQLPSGLDNPEMRGRLVDGFRNHFNTESARIEQMLMEIRRAEQGIRQVSQAAVPHLEKLEYKSCGDDVTEKVRAMGESNRGIENRWQQLSASCRPKTGLPPIHTGGPH